MFKPANISRLSPLRRGYVLGFRRARRKARAEIEALQDDFHELAVEHHRQCYDHALDAAIVQREMDTDIVLH
jgi:hypothetical protein